MAVSTKKATIHRARISLADRLRPRSLEIESSIVEKVVALQGPEEAMALDYVHGLRAAVAASVDLALSCLSNPDGPDDPTPTAALAQARRAARAGVGLDTMLRRYAAGERMFTSLIAAESGRVSPAVITEVHRDLGHAVDNLMEAVSSEYVLEMDRIRTRDPDRTEGRVRSLLAGDLSLERLEAYELRGWHLGAASDGQLDRVAMKELASQLRCQLLLTSGEQGQTWAWLGTERELDAESVISALTDLRLSSGILSVGEPRNGLAGWRQTIGEARLGLQYPHPNDSAVFRARGVLLTVAALTNPVVGRALLGTYMSALDDCAGTRQDIQITLRAYLESGQNASTAAAALQINRRTVERRIRTFEHALGRPIEDCHAELGVALDLDAVIDSIDTDR